MSFSVARFPDTIGNPIKPKDLPFYQVNWDPFKQVRNWEDIINDPSFWDKLKTIVEFNTVALNNWDFDTKNYQKRKQLFQEDITLQAFFISWKEVFTELWRCFSDYKIAEIQDIPDFGEFFSDYWEWEKRTFHNNLVFAIYWLKKLIDEYVRRGFYPDSKLYDFDRFHAHKPSIKQRIKSQQAGFGSAGADFSNGEFQCWSIGLNWNLNKWESVLKINDFPYHFWDQLLWFSEFLNKEKPFADIERLNFLFPLGYRGWVFPVINLKEIHVKMRDGWVKIYRYQTTSTNQRAIQHRAIWLLENSQE